MTTGCVAHDLIMVLDINDSSTWATIDLNELSDAVSAVANPEERCAASIQICQTALNDYRPTINLAVVGKTGEGKSSLINSLVGKQVCEEGDTKAITKKVNVHVEQVNGYDLKIFDTRGFFDGEDKEEDILKIMQDVNIDLLIVCVSMKDRAQSRDTRDTISLLTKTFGIEIWERATVVLTMANERAEDITRKAGNTPTPTPYNDVVDEFRKTLRNYLSRGEDEQHRKVPPSVIESIPIFPAGKHVKQRVDWRKLPDCEDWLSRFWMQCYERCSPEKKGTFAGMAEDSLLLHGDDGSVETLQQNLESTLRSWHVSSPGPSSGPYPGASASPRPSPSAESRQSASSDLSSGRPKIRIPKKKLQWGLILKYACAGANFAAKAAVRMGAEFSRLADRCEERSATRVLLVVASKLIKMELPHLTAGGIMGTFVGIQRMRVEYLKSKH